MSLLVAAVSGPRPAAAQEEPEALIRQGVEMRKRGDDLKAHGYFQRAYDLARTPRSAAQLGLADLAIGDNLAAEQHLSEALASNDPWVAHTKEVFETSRDKARAKLGHVIVTGAPASAVVEVAGRPAVPVPADGAIWVPPGSAELRFSAPNHQPVNKTVTVVAGAGTTLAIDLPPSVPAGGAAGGGGDRATEPPSTRPLPDVTQPGAPVDAANRPWQMTAAWVAGGAGVLFLAAGVTAQLLYA